MVNQRRIFLSSQLREYINQFHEQKILVIGDMVADVYLQGKISRISREAPVLVLEHMNEEIVPGGAANAVHNAATLGGQVFAVGVIGQDNAGEGLTSTLSRKCVITRGLLIDGDRPTITKTRVIAGGLATVSQQVVRIDKESKTKISNQTEIQLATCVSELLEQVDGVVISDYGSGTVTGDIRRQIISKCRERNIPCIVDSRYDIMSFADVSFIKQNEAEAAAATKIDIVDETSLYQAGTFLLKELRADGVLITRGGEGMALFKSTGETYHIPVSNKSEVYDVSGAGDTAVAAMILALAAGAPPEIAAELANFAAGIAVKKLGTATVTAAELKHEIGVFYDSSKK